MIASFLEVSDQTENIDTERDSNKFVFNFQRIKVYNDEYYIL